MFRENILMFSSRYLELHYMRFSVTTWNNKHRALQRKMMFAAPWFLFTTNIRGFLSS